MNFLFEDYYRTVSSSTIASKLPGYRPPQAKNIHCLSLPQNYYRVTKQGYQLNSAIQYETTAGLSCRIASSTLASRVNSYLHQISSTQADAHPALFAGLPQLATAQPADDAYVPRPMERYFASPKLQKEKILCDFCLSAKHVSLECYMPDLGSKTWAPEKDRREQPTTSSHAALVCISCRKLEHATCSEWTPEDQLFSNQDEVRNTVERFNHMIFSNELWGSNFSTPVRSTEDKEAVKKYTRESFSILRDNDESPDEIECIDDPGK